MTIYNMLNAHERPNLDEVNNEPSMTVPDEAMSLREILYRFAQGQELPIAHELPYHDEDELETTSGRHIDTLDLSEKQDLKKFNRKRIEDLENPEPPFVPDNTPEALQEAEKG